MKLPKFTVSVSAARTIRFGLLMLPVTAAFAWVVAEAYETPRYLPGMEPAIWPKNEIMILWFEGRAGEEVRVISESGDYVLAEVLRSGETVAIHRADIFHAAQPESMAIVNR